ncbi:hypothetical protein KW797_03775 [Candidatus Parcubacteria bacterium]|nr:hypothetical protein [Candidatus Parcubacteria bacterium]
MVKYDGLTLGQIEGVVNKLGGMDGVKRLLSGEVGIVLQEPKIWKKLPVNSLPLDEFLKKLIQAKVNTGGYKSDRGLKALMPLSNPPGLADLVLVPLWELGLRRGGNLSEIYDAAADLRLRPCPPAVAFELILSEHKKSRYDHVAAYIAIEPVASQGSRPVIFSIGYGDRGSWLHACIDEGELWDAGSKWIFCHKS